MQDIMECGYLKLSSTDSNRKSVEVADFIVECCFTHGSVKSNILRRWNVSFLLHSAGLLSCRLREPVISLRSFLVCNVHAVCVVRAAL